MNDNYRGAFGAQLDCRIGLGRLVGLSAVQSELSPKGTKRWQPGKRMRISFSANISLPLSKNIAWTVIRIDVRPKLASALLRLCVSPGHAAFSNKWKKSAARVKTHDMPPEGLDQPSDQERQRFAEWLEKVKYLSPKDPGPFIIRRLTKTEYGNTLHDLFGVDPNIVASLPDEVSGEGYLNSLSPLQLEQYLTISQKVLNQVLSPEGKPPTEIQKQLFGEPPASEADIQTMAHKVAQSLARKAYRRPPSDAEITGPAQGV